MRFYTSFVRRDEGRFFYAFLKENNIYVSFTLYPYLGETATQSVISPVSPFSPNQISLQSVLPQSIAAQLSGNLVYPTFQQ